MELCFLLDRLLGVRIWAPLLSACVLILSACSGTSSSPSTVAPVTTTTALEATTSTDPPSTSTTLPGATSSLQRLDESTLQQVGSPLTFAGFLADQHVSLPDGRLLLFTFEENDWKAFVVDPEAHRIDSEVEAPFSGGVRTLGYSVELDRVVMLGFGSTTPHLYLFDPTTASFDVDPVFGEEDLGWVHDAALIDGGRKVALYETFGYMEDRIGEPPQVRVGDLTTKTLGEPIEVTGVIHGHAELTPEAVRDPAWPYGDVEPAIAFDESGSQLFVVHADGAGLTVVDLLDGTTDVSDFAEPPGFWTSVMSWLIPPAQAKGSEPSASLSAWLNHDGSKLLVTGEAGDAWRDEEKKLHTTHTALGLMVIDTETLELERTLELPANRGLSTPDAVVLTGSEGTQVWCDEECKPGNNEPEVEGEYESSGLILLDPTSLELRLQYHPGDGFNPLGVYGDWLLVETSSEDWWGYESINLVTGQPGGRTNELFGTSYVLVTDQGIYLNGQNSP